MKSRFFSVGVDTMPHHKPAKGGLYVGKQGQMSRHYFGGARRVK